MPKALISDIVPVSEESHPWRLTKMKSLAFNLSHSDNIAVVAVGWNRNIGIDVERIRFDRDYHDLARALFPANQRKSWTDFGYKIRWALSFIVGRAKKHTRRREVAACNCPSACASACNLA